MADAGRGGPPDRRGDRIPARRRRAGQPALAVGGARAHPRPDARRRQHVPQPRHERGGPRRGPAGVRVRRSASTPSSGDARRHGAGGRPALRARARPSWTPTARGCPTPTLDARSDEVAAGMRAAGVGPGRRRAAAPAVGLDLRVAYAAAAKVGAITAGVNPRLAPPEQAAVAAAGGRGAHELEPPTRWRRCGGRSSWHRSLDDPERAGGARVHLGHHRAAEGRAVPRTAARRRHPHRRRRRVGRPGHAEPTPDARGHPVRPRRLHDQAAVVPAARHDHPRARPMAGRRRPGVHRRAAASRRSAASPPRSRCCCERTSSRTTSTACRRSSSAEPRRRPRWSARRGPASARRTRSATRPPRAGAAAPARRSTPTTTRRFFTVGRPRGGIEVGICDDEAGPVPDGEVGEVWLRSPTSMAEYWRDPRRPPTRSCGTGCAPATSASSTTRGCLRLAGRLKEMFIRGGYNVYPAEVERGAGRPPVGRRGGRRPATRRRDGRARRGGGRARRPVPPPDLEDLRAFLEPRLARYKLPEAHPDRRRAPAHPDAEGRPPRPGGPRRLRDPLTPRCHPRVDDAGTIDRSTWRRVRAGAVGGVGPVAARRQPAHRRRRGDGVPADDDGGRGDRTPHDARIRDRWRRDHALHSSLAGGPRRAGPGARAPRGHRRRPPADRPARRHRRGWGDAPRRQHRRRGAGAGAGHRPPRAPRARPARGRRRRRRAGQLDGSAGPVRPIGPSARRGGPGGGRDRRPGAGRAGRLARHRLGVRARGRPRRRARRRSDRRSVASVPIRRRWPRRPGPSPTGSARRGWP